MGTVGLLPAAGAARRLGISTPKELVGIRGRPVIDFSIDHLLEAGVDRLVIVIRGGKEAIVDHVQRRRPPVPVDWVFQEGAIGNLVDALRCARPALGDDDVLLLFPDTVLSPNPFLSPPLAHLLAADTQGPELVLLCHDAGDRWRDFGVVDPVTRSVIEKPTTFVGSMCWGAARWSPSFNDRLIGAATLTEAINQAKWEHLLCIERYRDIGLGSAM